MLHFLKKTDMANKIFYLVTYRSRKNSESYTKIRISKSREIKDRYLNKIGYDVTSCGLGYEKLEDLVKYEDLFICKECGQVSSRRFNNLLDKDTCIHCSIWLNLISKNNKSTIITTTYERYTISPDSDGPGFKGFGGRQFNIQMLDGSEIITKNLWHQGIIPIRFRHLVVPNAFTI